MMDNNKSSIELPLRDAYPFEKSHGLGCESDKIQRSRPPNRAHKSVYRRALMSELLTAHDLLGEFARDFWLHGSTTEGRKLLSSYQRVLLRHTKKEEGSWSSCDTDRGRLGQTELAVGRLNRRCLGSWNRTRILDSLKTMTNIQGGTRIDTGHICVQTGVLTNRRSSQRLSQCVAP